MEEKQPLRESSGHNGFAAGLVLLGVVFHACYVFSIFDIYFKSPIVHGMQPVKVSAEPPAKRVIFFVADGLRADRFFELNDSFADIGRERISGYLGLEPNMSTEESSIGPTRAPFLRHVLEQEGSWGVSHTRACMKTLAQLQRDGQRILCNTTPVERPQSLIELWPMELIPLATVFNQSVHSWLFGSPDIVPMFAQYPHVEEYHYQPEEEDFAAADGDNFVSFNCGMEELMTDNDAASLLDIWVFRKVVSMFRDAELNATLDELLRKPRVIIFLHLLGIDSNGHGHRPHSKEYLANIGLVDRGIREVRRVVDDFYKDNQTAYLFTADHGMSSKGSHGDGDPTNTRTPIVAWGAGIRGPEPANGSIDPLESSGPSSTQIKNQHDDKSEEESSSSWGLSHLRRKDVMQADIAPLIASLIGISMPMNSVGSLPLSFLAPGSHRAQSVAANAQQLLHTVERKSLLKEAASIAFRPYEGLQKAHDLMRSVRLDLVHGNLEEAELGSYQVIRLCLDGLDYFQKYDWHFLMTIIVLGYVGWILVLTIILSSPTLGPTAIIGATGRVSLGIAVLVYGLASAVLFWDGSPISYYAYILFPILFWVHIAVKRESIQRIVKKYGSKGGLMQAFILLMALEIVVIGYRNREVFSILFLVLSIWPWRYRYPQAVPRFGYSSHVIRGLWSVNSLMMAIFPLLPTDYGENTALVVLGGTLLLGIGFLDRSSSRSKLSYCQAFLVLTAIGLAYTTQRHLDMKMGLPRYLQISNWSVSVLSLFVPFYSPKSPLQRLLSVALGWAPFYILMSISYEVLFYCCLSTSMVLWMVNESVLNELKAGGGEGVREARIGFFFLLFINIAFFGTGNIASMSSFEVSSTYRFCTTFAPFLMGGLLVGKILIPLAAVTTSFSMITRILQKEPFRLFLVVLAISDILSINFFFLVRDEGSWKEIGNSISMFGIVNAQIVFIPLMFFIANLYTRQHFLSS